MLNIATVTRRLLALGAGLTVALAATVSAAPSASADSGCYVQLKVPSNVVVDRPYREVKVSLIDSCGVADYASFYIYGPEGMDDIAIFDGTTTDYLDVYDFNTLGSFKTRDGNAWDRDYNDIDARVTNFKIKLGTRASITSKRTSKSKVQLSVSSTSYSPTSDKFTGWNSSTAKVQYKSGSTWKTLKTVKLSSGKATFTTSTSATRTYRFVTAETSIRYGATSGTTRR